MSNYKHNIFFQITSQLESIYNSGTVDQLPELISTIQKYASLHNESVEAWQAKLLYNITSEALIIIENDIIVDCMVAFEKITGFTKNELLGQRFLETVHPNNYALISDFIKSEKNTTEKYEGLRKDNTVFYAEISVHKIEGDNKRIYLLIRDISPQYILEQKLRESETKFRNLANTTSVGIMIYQGEYWQYANPAAERISGYSEEELLKLKYWVIVAPEFREMIQKRGQERQQGEDVPSGYEFKIIAKGGIEKWVLLEGKLTLFNGKPAGLISIIDITHIKKIELNLKEKNKALNEKDRQLKQSNEKLSELNQKLQERNEALIIAKNKAEESDRLKSAFLANMSHEIRTPMNAIMGFAELLAESETLSESEKEFAQTIYQRSHHLLHIINDIVDISKIEANLLTITKSEFELNQFLDELKASFEQILQKKNKVKVEIIIKKAIDKINIFTDKNRLEQIITNLVGNSIKYTNEGSITIEYKNVEHNKIQFCISDTGTGIPEDQQDKVFDRFVMATNANSALQEGTGLGLAIAKSLSEILGGNIWINTEHKNGTSIHFSIDNTKVGISDTNEEADTRETRCQLKNKVVLVVEDDKWNASFLNNILHEKCAEVILCRTAEESIQILKDRNKIDLVLLDIKLPGMDGYDALPIIKSIKNIPVIAQTAYAFNEDRKKAMEIGFDDYIAKPIESDRLFRIIQNLLS